MVVRTRKDRREIVGSAVEACPVRPRDWILVALQEVGKNTNIFLARRSGRMTDVH